jgi:DNA-binding PadR family transcriptional regulator
VNLTSENINIEYPIQKMMRHRHCQMKGFLSFLILWLISKKGMTGSEITEELEKRKGNRPSPGTIYPVLKDLKERGLLSIDKDKRYSLTDAGKKELETHLNSFFETFCDIDEMRSKCKCHHHK